MDLGLYSSETGAVTGNISVSDKVFGANYNEALIHQVVTAYLAGARSGTKAQKSRAQVRGGGAKPWRQKGTGRARVGSIRSPLWRKGGVTFAQQAPRDYGQKLNRKMYRGGLRSILSELVRQGRLMVIDAFSVEVPKTRALMAKLKSLGLKEALIVTDALDEGLYLAGRNLQGVFIIEITALDPVSLINFAKVVFTNAAIQRLEAALT